MRDIPCVTIKIQNLIDRMGGMPIPSPFPSSVGRAAILVGLVAVGVSLPSSGVPDPSEDEAATISATARTWPEVIHLLGHVDAVHGVYYAAMKAWFGVVGTNLFTLRLPSIVAIGAAGALTVLLADRLVDRRVAVLSGGIFVFVPRVDWAALEGRPYALIILAAVSVTLLFLRALELHDGAGRTGAWATYGFGIILAVLLNIYLALIIAVHGLVFTREGSVARDADARKTVLRTRRPAWMITAGSAAILLLPFVLLVVGQSAQVRWIPMLSTETVKQIFVDTWFRSIWPIRGLGVVTLIAVPVGWTLLLIGVRAAVAEKDSRSDVPLIVAGRFLVFLTFGPIVILLASTALGKPLFAPHYVTLSVPFVAILMAVGIARLTRFRQTLALLLVVSVAIPSLVAIRLPHSHHDLFWSDAVQLMQRQRLASTGPDGIVFASLAELPSATSNLIAISYPRAFEGMRDLAVAGSRRREGRLFDRNGDFETVVPRRLRSLDNVWILGASRDDPKVAAARRVLQARGFSPVSSSVLGPVLLLELRRSR